MKTFFLASFALILGLFTPRFSGESSPKCCSSVSPAAPLNAPAVSYLEEIKALAGTWIYASEADNEKAAVATRLAVTAGGNAVLETLFPGTDHEMVSVYHADANALYLTHYCVLGNHPRMKASLDAQTGEIVFTCTGQGVNFSDCTKARHMHEGRVRILGADRMESRWTPWTDGVAQESVTFSLVRKAQD